MKKLSKYKRCCTCGLYKLRYKAFTAYLHLGARGERTHSECLLCAKTRATRWRMKNLGRWRAYQRAWHKDRRERLKLERQDDR